MTSEPEGDRLYALPLEQFTPARDALAARLRSAGDAAEAAAVKALKKPTTPAWAVNQLARSERDLVEQLIEASDRLRRAQQDLLHGAPAQEVWEATLAEREILGELSAAAQHALTVAGYGATRATLDRVSDTLAAAAADPAGRTLLRRGILTAEMHRAGFGDLLGGDAGAPRRLQVVPDAKPARDKPAPRPARGAARRTGPTSKQVLEAEREAASRARDATRAEEDAERAERAASRADDSADVARKRLGAAEKEASRARAAAVAAKKEARAARRDADRAAARLAKLRQSSRGVR
jgi:hypothetical protein